VSTDDLTREARAVAPTIHGEAATLLIQLADEVDRLREAALNSRLHIEGLEVELADVKDQRDEALAEAQRLSQ
jgi:hypothetical protein